MAVMAHRAASPPDRDPAGPGPVLMFPGQGSQHVGMGQSLLDASPAARLVFQLADEVLGWSVTDLCTKGPEQELTRTENLQPALFVVSMAALRALTSAVEPAPVAAMGHSLGEYAALVAAGAMDFSHALIAVRRRGEFMAEAVGEGEGGMAAVIGLQPEVVERICDDVAGDGGAVLSVANLNSPGQVVVSGHAEAIERTKAAFKEAGARGVIPLKVSAPFHCSLMRPAAERLEEVLGPIPISPPRFAVLSNVTGRPHGDPDSIRRLLVEQVIRPVRWIDCVRWTLDAGVDRFLEIGPGRVLAGLLRRIDRSVRCLGVCDPQTVADAGYFVQQIEEGDRG